MPAGLTTLLVYDRAGNPKTMLVYDDGSGQLSPVHRLDASQFDQLIDGLADLARVAPTITDISGTIAAGGTSQVLRAADASSKFLFVQNPPDATESLWIQDAKSGAGADQAAAIDDGKCIELPPGASYSWPQGVANRVSINATTTGHEFWARKG